MFKCHVCGSNIAHEQLISEIFQLEGKNILVENIPAQVCARCGEQVFSRATAEKLRLIVHGKARPLKSVKMDVFSFA